jgi:nitroreductase
MTAIIEAGNMAPSGHNQQPWRFVIVENPEVKRKLLQITLPLDQAMLEHLQVTDSQLYDSIQKTVQSSPEDPIYYSAPVILFVIGTTEGTERIDCPLVCQNILLAAHSVGIGSCIVGAGRRGLRDNPEVVKAFKLTEKETIYPPIVLGYPKSYPESPSKKKPQIMWIK